MHLPDPQFPPLLSGQPVNAPETAFEAACRRAALGELGAADVVWSRNTRRCELAIILEPEVSGLRSLEMLPLLATAMADSVGALMPPKTSVQLRWPTSILINGAEAGELAIAVESLDADTAPAWLVLGCALEIMPDPSDPEPGLAEHRTTLYEEGGADLDRTRMLQSLSAHFLTWINIWQDDGFAAVHDAFIGRLEGHTDPARIDTGEGEHVSGTVLGLSDDMELLVRTEAAGDTRALQLRAAVTVQANGSNAGCAKVTG